MKLFLSVLILLLLLQSYAKAEDYFYELPDLQGYYSWAGGETNRGDTLTYSGITVTVRSIKLNLWGSTSSGLLECCMPEYPYHCEMYTWSGLQLICIIKRPQDQGEWSLETTINGSGEKELSYDLTTHNGFNILNEGDLILINLIIQPSGIPSDPCFDVWPPEANLNRVQLFIDADDVTPVESISWGRIKAIYAD